MTWRILFVFLAFVAAGIVYASDLWRQAISLVDGKGMILAGLALAGYVIYLFTWSEA